MKITISGLAAPDKIELPKRPPEDPRNWSVSQLDIYLRLLEILDDCDIRLSHYPVFNPDNLEAAYYLVAYYKQITVPFVIHKPVYLNFAFDDNENVDKPEIAVGKGYYAFIEESCDNIINFGEATITIPYRHSFYSKCSILEDYIGEDGYRHLKVCDNSEYGFFTLSDNPEMTKVYKKASKRIINIISEAQKIVGKIPGM